MNSGYHQHGGVPESSIGMLVSLFSQVLATGSWNSLCMGLAENSVTDLKC